MGGLSLAALLAAYDDPAPRAVAATGTGFPRTFFAVDQHYERLSEIAPTVTNTRGSYVDTWQEQTLLIGRALAAEEAAAAAVTGVEFRIDRILPDFQGRTCSLSHCYEPGAIAVLADPEDYAAVFFRSLGLESAPGLDPLAHGSGVDSAIIGLEQLSLLDADLLIMTHASAELRQAIEANPLVPDFAEALRQ